MSRDRSQPRSSICKLAEYLVAGPARRRSILRDQKYPRAYKTTNYREAYPAIVEVLARGGDVRLLDEFVAEWRRRAPKSRFEADCLALWIDALVAFKPILASGAFDGLTFAPGLSVAYFDVAGVELSVRPEALIIGPNRGALKLYLSKSARLTADTPGVPGSASYAAAALHWWAATRFKAIPETCKVVDVFAGLVHTAPARYTKRRADITAGCEETAAVWSSIKAPPGTPDPDIEMPF